MLHASDVATIGFPDFEESQVLEVFAGEAFDPGADSWLVRGPDGAVACWGYLDGEAGDPFCEAYQDPGVTAALQGPMMSLLVERAIERARAAGLAEVTLGAGAVIGTEDHYIAVIESHGFAFRNHSARMTRPLTGDEKRPVPPDGVVIRQMRPEELPLHHEMIVTAFADTSHPETQSLAALTEETVRPQPGTAWDEWLMAEVDGEIAGTLRSSNQSADKNEGWVKRLAVRPAYRGRGVARALLETAFAIYAEKGRVAVGLGVDTGNPTGAYRLYESVGMTPAYRCNDYERTVTL